MLTMLAVLQRLASMTSMWVSPSRIMAPRPFQGSMTKSSSFHYGVNEEYMFRRGTTKETSSTRNDAEVDKFRELADSWWDLDGDCKALHSMNKLRVALIRDGLVASGKVLDNSSSSSKMLENIRILDVGCGGGLLSEPLARLGANVIGLDAAEENIVVATDHAKKDQDLTGRLKYVCSTVEEFAEKASGEEKFDAVVASEVIEHVNNQPLFVSTCASLVNEGGSIFFTTLNRNSKSYLAGVIAAECILGLLPRGTHDWEKFVKPEELDDMLKGAGCQTRLIHGMFYWPVFNQWSWIPQATVNYALHAIKRES